MNRIKKVFLFFLIVAGDAAILSAGNPDRIGQAGAYELIINPWARSSGFHGLNSASVKGIESMTSNVGGLSFIKKTEVVFARTTWLKGTDVNINSFGLAQKVGENGVLGLNIMAVDFGDIPITTTSIPDGGIGEFSPQFINIGLGYSRVFSNSIHGGLVLRAVSEAISDVKAQGIAIDAGIQYVTGPSDNIKFGIALRNVGTPMKFGGDGLKYRAVPPSNSYQYGVEQRAEAFELPALLNVGGGYDFKIKEMHRLSLEGTFTSNSFSRDQIGVGAEYAFREHFMARAGYRYEKIDEERKDAFNGFSAGFTIELPLKKDGATIGIDYSYRGTRVFSGTHGIGARINL